MEEEKLDWILGANEELLVISFKVEKWSAEISIHYLKSLGYGGWISVSNLPLCKRDIFGAFRKHFGGVISISSQTLNLFDCTRARIQVKKNLVVFFQLILKSRTPRLVILFLKFGDISSLDPPSIVIKIYFLENYLSSPRVLKNRCIWSLNFQFCQFSLSVLKNKFNTSQFSFHTLIRYFLLF